MTVAVGFHIEIFAEFVQKIFVYDAESVLNVNQCLSNPGLMSLAFVVPEYHILWCCVAYIFQTS